jgi:PTH1 family peptidyl-tRNA hydrolase
MKIIVGLGNPGKEYDNTPHNAGFIALELFESFFISSGYTVETWHNSQKEKAEIAEVYDSKMTRVAVMVRPMTYMNLSGGAVQQVMHKYGVREQQDILVMYDDLDLKLGAFKYSPIKNSPTHKGIGSIISTIGKGVHSLRIGVDNRVNRQIPGEDFVLRRFATKDTEILRDSIKTAIQQHSRDFFGLV